MLQQVINRTREPSTAAGGGLLAFGLNEMAVDPQTVQAGVDVASMALPVLLAPTPVGLLSLGLGLYAMFKGEGHGQP